ncbi:alkene reductase [soil metagenome]
MKLFSDYKLGSITLKNRIVMAPMTRSRAIGNVPNDLMATYYGQRATAGLIITEGISPSANGLGYARIPGLFSQEQVEGWRLTTAAVHAKGGKIFAQLMHTGRASHQDNLPSGAEVVSASAIALSGNMWTDQNGMQPYPTPRVIETSEIAATQEEYATASKNAIAAGFDGVELHGANGYLIEQFLNTASNKRTDNYGGNVENRNRFAIETVEKLVAAIGADKTAIRLSPCGVFNDIEIYEGIEDAFIELVTALGKLNIAYIHIVDHSSQGAPTVPQELKTKLQNAFGGTFIYSGGLDKASAEAVLLEGRGDLVAFGRPYLANPDLVARFENDLELAQPDFSKAYTPGPEGYTDYPVAAQTVA